VRSIARRLTVSLVVGGGIVLGVLFVWLHFAIEHELFSRFDAALVARARALAGVIAARPVDQVGVDQRWPEYAAGGHQEFYQLWDAAGHVLARSTSSAGADLQRPAQAPQTLPELYDLDLPDGHHGRAVALVAWPAVNDRLPTEPHLLVVATEREALDQLEQRLHLVLILGTAVALAVMALIGVLAVRGGLAPLEAFGRNLAARISAHAPADAQGREATNRRSPPVTTSALPAELVPIAETLNQAIDEALTALRREQRFAREAAHELRTPLAEIHLIAQGLAVSSSDTAALLKVVDRMTRSIDALLALARCEAGLDVPAIEPLDLSALVGEELARCAAASARRGLVIECEGPDELWVMSDPAMLERIIVNLVGNAVTHAPRSARVSVRLDVRAERATVTVRNPAPGIAAEQLAAAARDGEGEIGGREIGGQFTYLDAQAAFDISARSEISKLSPSLPPHLPGDGHAGIGLALVAALARQLALELTFRDADGELEVVIGAIALVPSPQAAQTAPRL
jgi:two-component system, OmpR family, sensor histidine kinase QseC